MRRFVGKQLSLSIDRIHQMECRHYPSEPPVVQTSTLVKYSTDFLFRSVWPIDRMRRARSGIFLGCLSGCWPEGADTSAVLIEIQSYPRLSIEPATESRLPALPPNKASQSLHRAISGLFSPVKKNPGTVSTKILRSWSSFRYSSLEQVTV